MRLLSSPSLSSGSSARATSVCRAASKVVAESLDGSFCLLPRHLDYAAALVPGVLLIETPAGDEVVFAVDEGVLVKRGDDVTVAVRQAVRGEDLGQLRRAVQQRALLMNDSERRLRSSLARLEASFRTASIAM